MKPFRQGQLDFKRGQVVNPFNQDTARYKDWEMGFNKAYFLNLEKVKKYERKYKKSLKKEARQESRV